MPVLPSFRYRITSMLLGGGSMAPARQTNASQTEREMLSALLRVMILSRRLGAATIRLYMKDGTYHYVREYEKHNDRIRYFSTERDDWEELPVDLVDLKRTEAEKAQNEAARREDAAAFDAEEKAEREQRQRDRAHPREPRRVYGGRREGDHVAQAEVKMVNNKRRSILKAVTPIPIVAGKSTVELDGLKSALPLPVARPEFYFRLAKEERYGDGSPESQERRLASCRL